MDLRKLKTLIDLVSESNITELEITEAEGKVRIVKGGAEGAAPVYRARGGRHADDGRGAGRRAGRPGGRGRAGGPVGPDDQVADGRHLLPLVQPGGKPFVDVGSPIKEGEPVCIIEAMKIMNEIEADCSGRITRILVENGQAVEFGQPLFIVE